MDLEISIPEMSFVALVRSDYRAARNWRPEPPWRSLLLFMPRLMINPSLQLALLVRIAQKGPKVVQHPVRWLQVVLFSSEFYWFKRPGTIEVGPGITFPHPSQIMIGAGSRFGTGVVLYHGTTVGADRHWTPGGPTDRAPWIGDRAVIYSYAAVQGPWRIGHDAVVGIHTVVDQHVPPGALATRRGIRLRGEWPGEHRPR